MRILCGAGAPAQVCLLLAIVAGVGPIPVEAQMGDGADEPETFSSFGMGVGGWGLPVSLTDRSVGLAFTARFGRIETERLSWGFDVTSWARADDGELLSLSNVSLAAWLHEDPAQAFYLKFGAGLGVIATTHGIGLGPGAVVGIGSGRPIIGNLAPFANYSWSFTGHLSTSIVSFGLSTTWFRSATVRRGDPRSGSAPVSCIKSSGSSGVRVAEIF